MSAFGDFGPLSERRKAELQQRRRKRCMIAGGAVSVIIIIAAVAAVAIIFVGKANDKDDRKSDKHPATTTTAAAPTSDKENKKSAAPPKPTVVIGSSEHIVATLCASTDHKKSCKESLKNATNSTSKPKDYVKAAVSVVYDEVGSAFNQSSAHQSEDPLIKGAVGICFRLLDLSHQDLNETINKIDVSTLADLPKVGPLLNVWLSAVRTYQETCVDAFPNGPVKEDMRVAMKLVNDLTSNALAIVTKATKFMASFDLGGINRRLLSAEDEDNYTTSGVDEEGIPLWVGDDDERRALKENPAAALTPDVTVAQDGSGQFMTINEALNAIPVIRPPEQRYVIFVKTGVYNEQVIVPRNMTNITMYGEGNVKTIVTGDKNSKLGGVNTYDSATFAVEADGFMCLNMGFRNTAGPAGEQAVALRVSADCAVFLNCRMEAFQDTLFAHTKRQLYRNCDILGTVDYIFGNAAAIFQSCVLTTRLPGPGQQNIITAHGRTGPQERTGFVMQSCKVEAGADLAPVQAEVKSYLARPWKKYSRTVFMESEIGDFIDPAGYLAWENTTVGQNTCVYGEYKNTGVGAATAQRAAWKGVKRAMTKKQATAYTASAFVVDIVSWSKKYGVAVPLRSGFFQK